MNRAEMMELPVSELLARTQTNITRDARDGFDIAQVAYERAETAVQKGTAARQAGFRAEQAGYDPEIVREWFDNSRSALSSDNPQIKRELIATELLIGRAFALRVVRMGSKVAELVTVADEAFQHGEAILKEQHTTAQPWDSFGTMLARHRATHEAMNGKARSGVTTAVRGMWRAIRAKREGTPEDHRAFVVKQLGMSAMAGMLAASKPLAFIPKVSSARHQRALRLLG